MMFSRASKGEPVRLQQMVPNPWIHRRLCFKSISHKTKEEYMDVGRGLVGKAGGVTRYGREKRGWGES